jgi:hypothetical protein
MTLKKNKITIMPKCVSILARRILPSSFVFLLLALVENRALADNSFGFLFDHFQLTLEQGCRTEAAGPLYYSRHEDESDASTIAFPPLFSDYRDPSVESREDDFLYPLFTSIHYGQERRWQFFQLISSAGGQEPDGNTQDRFTLFPFYFQQRSTDANKDYTALFPVYGHLQNRLWRDNIFFVLFPVYVQTKKRDIVTDNYVFPIVHVRHGDGLHGWQVWPAVGSERKIVTLQTNGFGDVLTNGGHDGFFFLWPLWFDQDNGIGTDNPETFRASIPLFVYSRSPKVDLTTVIWPFFNWIDEREKKYHEWQAPWPFIVFARGEGKATSRVFPLFQLSRNDTLESDFCLWPLYTFRRTHSDPLDYCRTRVLFFLYADIVEKNTKTDGYKRRLDMWPFFTWHRDFNGNERLQVLAPIEPAVPDNRGIERNWSPLWSLWRAENNPKAGASSHSLLWNLYRDETAPARKKVSLLFGLFQYQYDGETRRTKLFYTTVFKMSATTK